MNTAVYAGSFDPVTTGHIAIMEKAVCLFDRLIILIADNPDKKPLFSSNERMEMLKMATSEIKRIDYAATDGLVAVFARAHGAGFLVRGVRDSTDAEYEMKLTALNKMIAPEVHTVFIPSEPCMSGVSSSRSKELARLGQDIRDYCPPPVCAMLERKMAAIQ